MCIFIRTYFLSLPWLLDPGRRAAAVSLSEAAPAGFIRKTLYINIKTDKRKVNVEEKEKKGRLLVSSFLLSFNYVVVIVMHATVLSNASSCIREKCNDNNTTTQIRRWEWVYYKILLFTYR